MTHLQIQVIKEMTNLQQSEAKLKSESNEMIFYQILNILNHMQTKLTLSEFAFGVELVIGEYVSLYSQSEAIDIKLEALCKASYLLLIWLLGVEVPRSTGKQGLDKGSHEIEDI